MSNNHNGKKLPYFIGIGMLAFGILMMLLSGQLDEGARTPLIFVGVLVFIGGFAAMVIYSTRKQAEYDENGKKKPKSRAEKIMWTCGAFCLAGLLTLIAGFVLFGEMNMAAVLIGMAVFLISGSIMISIFQKHASEFLDKDEDDNNDK